MGVAMNDLPEQAEPANLRFLRRLVTTLTAVMIVGLLVLIGLIVIRLQQPSVTFPDAITLPDGETATNYTPGPGWYAVATASDKIIIFDAASGEIRQTIDVE
jgi:hypothetical protein